MALKSNGTKAPMEIFAASYYSLLGKITIPYAEIRSLQQNFTIALLAGEGWP